MPSPEPAGVAKHHLVIAGVMLGKPNAGLTRRRAEAVPAVKITVVDKWN